ncbi:hypothetical protein Acsp04_51620 [Actinomadura sp. NBRC 104425]|uniref:cytochrome P450 n=1 Tax=Actinomadura sp. NBRC 104425 TaxID=3032204 RepID=UPI0024A0FCA9|nr:cytochrome P450 [Actinomadura sp. NBRC 104425]GLZ14927.1 hypothetical protein Acsp04_51620 [Actinomadura sp. NBRC 104425]
MDRTATSVTSLRRPLRFLDARPDLYGWIPFGGGGRRRLGAAFATMEMNVVLRTVLRDFTLVPTAAPNERRRSYSGR